MSMLYYFSILLALSAMAFAKPADFRPDTWVAKNCTGVVCWVKLEEANKQNLILGGKEFYYSPVSQLDSYVGRTRHLDGLIVGKYIFEQNVLYFNHNGGEVMTRANVELLEYIPGTLSWVHEWPHDPIVGGHDPKTHEQLIICRGWVDGHIIIGKFRFGTDYCTVPYHGETRAYWMEILALNDLGYLMNHNMQKRHIPY